MKTYSYLCSVTIKNYIMDKETKFLNAIMGRYGSLTTLKLAMWEDEDTVLVNLADDLDDEFYEQEILEYIHKILG